MNESRALPKAASGRIVWLDILRAIAVLLVVFGHIFQVGLDDWKTVSVWIPTVEGFIFGPGSPSRNTLGALGAVLADKTGVSTGGVGVALFFLISGFVILRTLDRAKPGDFLLRRAIRIFPVSAAAVISTSAGLAGFYYAAGLPQPFSFYDVASSSFAMSGWLQTFTIIPVLWSLAAEMVFYLIMACAAASTRRIGFPIILGLSVLCLLFTVQSKFIGITPYLSVYGDYLLRYNTELLVYVSFMLVGSAIYRAQSNLRPMASATFCILMVVVFFTNYYSFKALVRPSLGMNAEDIVVALMIFIPAMRFSMDAGWLKPLRWVAEISYPLYLMHIPLGWGVLVLCAYLGLGVTFSGFVAIAVVMLASWVLHLLVEEPSHQFGRWITRKRAAQASLSRAHPLAN